MLRTTNPTTYATSQRTWNLYYCLLSRRQMELVLSAPVYRSTRCSVPEDGHVVSACASALRRRGTKHKFRYYAALLACKRSFKVMRNVTQTVRGSAVGWCTALQFGRSRVQFPMGLLEFFIDVILLATLCPWGRLSLWQKWVPGIFPGGLKRLVQGLTTLPPSCACCLEILGASTFWSPKGLSRPIVMQNGIYTSIPISVILILLSYQRLGLPNGLLHLGFPTKMLHAFLIYAMRATSHAHLFLLECPFSVTLTYARIHFLFIGLRGYRTFRSINSCSNMSSSL